MRAVTYSYTRAKFAFLPKEGVLRGGPADMPSIMKLARTDSTQWPEQF